MAPIRPEMMSRKASARGGPVSERLVFTVEEAGKLLGLGRNAAYDGAKRGDIPTIRVGRLLRVPKAPFLKMLGADLGVSPPHASGADLDNAKEKSRGNDAADL